MPVNPGSKDCVQEEMARWRAGELHSGTGKSGQKGPIVRNKKQALAIAISACGKSDYADRLSGLGFSEESLQEISELLFRSPDWKNQFRVGETNVQLPRENKTTIAPSLPGFDIDDRPGKQPGDQGKQKKQSSLSLSPVALPKGNPQPGPRSRSDLKGLAMFGERQ